MAKKPLQELLKEEQEPFVLTNYINEKRSQFRRSPPKAHLQLNRRRPTSQVPVFPYSLGKTTCFFPSNAVKSSPRFDFHSPKTIPRLKPSQKPKNLGFGLLGSILKRISLRKKAQKREICGQEIRMSVRDILVWDPFDGLRRFSEEQNEEEILESESDGASEVGVSCSCESSGWSEDFEGNSFDLEVSSSTSISSCRHLEVEEKDGGLRPCKMGFCASPLRLAELAMVSESGRQVPELSSPVETPRRQTEVFRTALGPGTLSNSADGTVNGNHKEYDEEEKDQFSPVSVLDAPFDDDDDDDDGREKDGEEEDVEDFEHTFAAMLRAKYPLLSKIRRFESPADLDPLELEKRIAEAEAEEECDGTESLEIFMEEEFIGQILSHSDGYSQLKRIPEDMKRLLLDLADEERVDSTMEMEVVAERVSKRIDLWNHVKLNTIDMMVDLDFRKADEEWRKNPLEVQEVAADIESTIFSWLVGELAVDLV